MKPPKQLKDAVHKRIKWATCKVVIREFESHPRLLYLTVASKVLSGEYLNLNKRIGYDDKRYRGAL